MYNYINYNYNCYIRNVISLIQYKILKLFFLFVFCICIAEIPSQ